MVRFFEYAFDCPVHSWYDEVNLMAISDPRQKPPPRSRDVLLCRTMGIHCSSMASQAR